MNIKDKKYIENTLIMIKELMDSSVFEIIDSTEYKNDDVYNGICHAIKKLNK